MERNGVSAMDLEIRDQGALSRYQRVQVMLDGSVIGNAQGKFAKRALHFGYRDVHAITSYSSHDRSYQRQGLW